MEIYIYIVNKNYSGLICTASYPCTIETEDGVDRVFFKIRGNTWSHEVAHANQVMFEPTQTNIDAHRTKTLKNIYDGASCFVVVYDNMPNAAVTAMKATAQAKLLNRVRIIEKDIADQHMEIYNQAGALLDLLGVAALNTPTLMMAIRGEPSTKKGDIQ